MPRHSLKPLATMSTFFGDNICTILYLFAKTHFEEIIFSPFGIYLTKEKIILSYKILSSS